MIYGLPVLAAAAGQGLRCCGERGQQQVRSIDLFDVALFCLFVLQSSLMSVCSSLCVCLSVCLCVCVYVCAIKHPSRTEPMARISRTDDVCFFIFYLELSCDVLFMSRLLLLLTACLRLMSPLFVSLFGSLILI